MNIIYLFDTEKGHHRLYMAGDLSNAIAFATLYDGDFFKLHGYWFCAI